MAARHDGQESDRQKKKKMRKRETEVGRRKRTAEVLKGICLISMESTQNNKLSNQGFPSLALCVITGVS